MEKQIDVSLFKAVFSEAVEKLARMVLANANNLAREAGGVDSRTLERVLLEALAMSRDEVENLLRQRLQEMGLEVESVAVNPWYTATTGLYFPTKNIMGDICVETKDGVEVCDKFALAFSTTADGKIVLQGIRYPVDQGECPSVEFEIK